MKSYGEFVTSQGWTGSSAPTVLLKFSGRFVGVDAHIDPAAQTVFTEIQCEFVGTQWGDVGIAPYACLCNLRENVQATCGTSQPSVCFW